MAHSQSSDCRPSLGICDGHARVNPHGRMVLSTPRRVVLRVRQNNPTCKCLVNLKMLDKWWLLVLSITHRGASRAGPSSLTRQATGTLEHTPGQHKRELTQGHSAPSLNLQALPGHLRGGSVQCPGGKGVDAPDLTFLIQDAPITPKVLLPWQSTQVRLLLPTGSPVRGTSCFLQ